MYHIKTLEVYSYKNTRGVSCKILEVLNVRYANILKLVLPCWALKLVFSSSCSHGLPCFPRSEACAFVLGNICERFCASRPLLGSYVHQESI